MPASDFGFLIVLPEGWLTTDLTINHVGFPGNTFSIAYGSGVVGLSDPVVDITADLDAFEVLLGRMRLWSNITQTTAGVTPVTDESYQSQFFRYASTDPVPGVALQVTSSFLNLTIPWEAATGLFTLPQHPFAALSWQAWQQLLNDLAELLRRARAY